MEFARIFCWRHLHEYNAKQHIRRQDALEVVVMPNQSLTAGRPGAGKWRFTPWRLRR